MTWLESLCFTCGTKGWSIRLLSGSLSQLVHYPKRSSKSLWWWCCNHWVSTGTSQACTLSWCPSTTSMTFTSVATFQMQPFSAPFSTDCKREILTQKCWGMPCDFGSVSSYPTFGLWWLWRGRITWLICFLVLPTLGFRWWSVRHWATSRMFCFWVTGRKPESCWCTPLAFFADGRTPSHSF